MTPEDWWVLGLAIGGVGVTMVAVLLGLMLATARRIDRNAATLWRVGKEIAGNTIALSTLPEMADAATRLRRAAERLEESAAAITERIGGGAVGAGAGGAGA